MSVTWEITTECQRWDVSHESYLSDVSYHDHDTKVISEMHLSDVITEMSTLRMGHKMLSLIIRHEMSLLRDNFVMPVIRELSLRCHLSDVSHEKVISLMPTSDGWHVRAWSWGLTWEIILCDITTEMLSPMTDMRDNFVMSSHWCRLWEITTERQRWQSDLSDVITIISLSENW